MSLINRMLDDLAARQAPGAETLSGVRLNDPMGEANASLNTRTLWVLIAIALGATALVWFLWSAQGTISMPQSRTALGQPAEPPATAAAPARPVVTAAQPTTRATALAPSLRFDSLTSLRSSDARFARAEPIGESNGEGDDAVIADRAPVPVTKAPRSIPPAPTLRSATSIVLPPAAAAPPGDRRAPRQSHAAPAPPAQPGILGADTLSPAATPTEASTKTTTARDALSRGDPATALALLGPTRSDHDAETASLRAAALQRLGRHREAADAYRGLTQGDPSESGHWVGLAISLEGQQKREEARIAYRHALQSSQLAPSLRAFAQARVTVLEAP